MQIGFYFDQSRCIACYTCVAACRSWNQLDPQDPDLIQIVSQERGEFPNVSLSHLFITCFHCADPPCVRTCPAGLLMKREKDGIVIVNTPEQCTNCQLCVEACPYYAPKMSTGGEGKILKCNLCLDRLGERKPPACVASCPTEALDVGEMDRLVSEHGEARELEGFPDCRKTNPSIVFKARLIV